MPEKQKIRIQLEISIMLERDTAGTAENMKEITIPANNKIKGAEKTVLEIIIFLEVV
ncbi:MAG: hypothetical protein ABIH89_07595 [Elusimicrobiota bacterium]